MDLPAEIRARFNNQNVAKLDCVERMSNYYCLCRESPCERGLLFSRLAPLLLLQLL